MSNDAKILGLGGVFFKVDDKPSYLAWWKDVMGMNVSEWGSVEFQSDGQAFTVFSPFGADTEYFAPSDSPFMINLRVNDARAMLEKAVQGGAKAVGEVDDTDYGVFAWFIDPAGIKIELWQAPPGAKP